MKTGKTDFFPIFLPPCFCLNPCAFRLDFPRDCPRSSDENENTEVRSVIDMDILGHIGDHQAIRRLTYLYLLSLGATGIQTGWVNGISQLEPM
jgi:hypothetical protein